MIPEKGKTFTCEMCGLEYVSPVEKDEAIAKHELDSGEKVSEETHTVVCDDCFAILERAMKEEK